MATDGALRQSKLLVGIGNLLRGDDGVGVWLAHLVERGRLLSGVEVVDAGTAAFLPDSLLEGRDQVVVVDAAQAGGRPGEIFCLPAEALRPFARSETKVLHGLHLLDLLLEALRADHSSVKVTFVAIQVCDTSWSIGLSPPVRQALGRLLTLVARELVVRPADWCPESCYAELHGDLFRSFASSR